MSGSGIKRGLIRLWVAPAVAWWLSAPIIWIIEVAKLRGGMQNLSHMAQLNLADLTMIMIVPAYVFVAGYIIVASIQWIREGFKSESSQ
jgi:hypothetical protein